MQNPNPLAWDMALWGTGKEELSLSPILKEGLYSLQPHWEQNHSMKACLILKTTWVLFKGVQEKRHSMQVLSRDAQVLPKCSLQQVPLFPETQSHHASHLGTEKHLPRPQDLGSEKLRASPSPATH